MSSEMSGFADFVLIFEAILSTCILEEPTTQDIVVVDSTTKLEKFREETSTATSVNYIATQTSDVWKMSTSNSPTISTTTPTTTKHEHQAAGVKSNVTDSVDDEEEDANSEPSSADKAGWYSNDYVLIGELAIHTFTLPIIQILSFLNWVTHTFS